MNEHLTEVKMKINEEINHRTYSPLLFFVFIALVIEHYEIALYILDSSLSSAEKISKVEIYWSTANNIYQPFISGAIAFLAWCFIHPVSALIWDLIKRSIIWVRKTQIYKIPVIPESDYEALQDEYDEDRKRLNFEHSEMAVKVEIIKQQLEQSKNEVQRNKDEIIRIKDQFSTEKERLINARKEGIDNIKRSSKRELDEEKRLSSQLESDLLIRTQESEELTKNLKKLKLDIFDKENWEEDSISFIQSGFRWRIAFDYLSPTIEGQMVTLFLLENIQFQKKALSSNKCNLTMQPVNLLAAP
jgi:hypothetical protein